MVLPSLFAVDGKPEGWALGGDQKFLAGLGGAHATCLQLKSFLPAFWLKCVVERCQTGSRGYDFPHANRAQTREAECDRPATGLHHRSGRMLDRSRFGTPFLRRSQADSGAVSRHFDTC